MRGGKEVGERSEAAKWESEVAGYRAGVYFHLQSRWAAVITVALASRRVVSCRDNAGWSRESIEKSISPLVDVVATWNQEKGLTAARQRVCLWANPRLCFRVYFRECQVPRLGSWDAGWRRSCLRVFPSRRMPAAMYFKVCEVIICTASDVRF